MSQNRNISVIIPTITGREDWLKECLAVYKKRSPESTEFIVIKDEPSCGHAWLKGYEQSSGHFIHFTADDIQPASGWWPEALRMLDNGIIPAAYIVDQKNTPNMCDSPLGKMGTWPNILVPTLTRPMLEQGEFLPDFHYGSDDWVTYRAIHLGYNVRRLQTYKFVHFVAPQGRNYTRRRQDVAKLVETMEDHGYVPPVYRELEIRLRDSKTGLDSVSLAQLVRKNRKLYTASQFKDEVNVLEIRLKTIGHLVDKIVLAEATVDQRGRPRELVWPKWQHTVRFRAWASQIHYVIVDDMPKGDTHADDVARERHQRDALIRGMPDLTVDDLVYVSDLDEIPYPDALVEGFVNPPVRFGMDMHVYALNWRWLDRGCRAGTLGAVVTGKSILEQGVCGAVLHDSRVKQRPGVSGWHLHNMGGVKSVRDKVEGMMDKVPDLMPKEWHGNPPKGFMSDEWIMECIKTGRDLFGREAFRPTEWVDIDQMPPCVQENPKRYKSMMVPKPPGQDEKESRPRCTCGAIYHGDELWHFPYCALAEVEGTKIHQSDDRSKPRAAG